MRQFAAGVLLLAAGAAHADSARPPELAALRALLRNVTWTGKTLVGKGVMPKTTSGKSTCRWLLEDTVVACEMEEQGLTPKPWRGHLTVGWDADAKEFRALLADNTGSAGVLTGHLDGKKLTLTSALRSTLDGKPSRFRLGWEPADGGAIRFTEEVSANGGPFTVSEEATMKPE